jgi:hypothetical protein
MADDAKSIGKSLAEISASLKDGIKSSEGNQAAEKEAANEDKRSRNKLFAGLQKSIDTMGAGLKNLTGGVGRGGSFFAGLLGGVFAIAMRFLRPVLTFFGKAGPIARMAARFLPFLGPAGHIARLGLKFLGPLVLLIDGIIGFVQGWMESDESNLGLRLVDGLQGAFSNILSKLTFGFVSYDVIQEFTEPFFNYIKDWFISIFAIWDDESLGFGEKIWLSIKKVFEAFVDYLVFTWDLTVAGIKMAWDGLAYALSPEGLMAAGTAIADAFMYVSDWVGSVFEKPITYMAMIMDRITNALKVMFYDVIGAINGFTENLPLGLGFSVLGGSEAAKKASQDAVMEGLRNAAAYQQMFDAMDEKAKEEKRREEERSLQRDKDYRDQHGLGIARSENQKRREELLLGNARPAEGNRTTITNVARGGDNYYPPPMRSRNLRVV